MPLCDTALRLAQRGVYALRWSDRILQEAEKNLIELGRFDTEKIRRRFRVIREQFADAEVTGYMQLIDSMRCDRKDRHVLAAAVRASANQIVTSNLRDFPDETVRPYDIEVVSPDAFLLNSLDAAPRTTYEVLREQIAALKRPVDVLATLAKAGAPEF